MIETTSDLTRFQLENQRGDWIVHVVPEDSNFHSAVSHPSIIFIRNILTGKSYYYSCNHPDSRPKFENLMFREILHSYSNRKWAFDKKAIGHMLGLTNVCDANLVSWMQTNEIFELSEYETPAHYLVRKNAMENFRLNLSIPLMKHKEAFEALADDLVKLVSGYEPDLSFIRFNDLIIGTLGELETQGIFVDREMFQKRFELDPGPSDMVWSQYNVYTATGRPSNCYENVNYAALNHSDGTRKCFRSRFGKDGSMVLLDYTAFHPRIISRLTKYDVPITTNIYEYLAKLYFHKTVVDETDIANAKVLTFRQVYGGVEDKYAHIKWFRGLKSFINEQWEHFQSKGYVLTPFFKRRITSKHVSDPNPPKVFNYILQAVEGELSIPKVKGVLDYLRDKKTKAVLYTYDSVLCDYYNPEGMGIIKDIQSIMSFGGRFPMKAYMGETYQDVKLISI